MIEPVLTKDGSLTLRHPSGDHYHSLHGAIQEAQHVYIKEGLNQLLLPNLRVLEVGFGTGLNTWLTFINGQERHIDYIALEPFPLSIEEVSLLNYPSFFESFHDVFSSLHQVQWNQSSHLSDSFLLLKLICSIQDLSLESPVDLIYFDAFAPRHQPELWEPSIFERCFSFLNWGGRLVTYCAKGSVKRALREVGFTVVSRPGPPGKREMTVAIKEKS